MWDPGGINLQRRMSWDLGCVKGRVSLFPSGGSEFEAKCIVNFSSGNTYCLQIKCAPEFPSSKQVARGAKPTYWGMLDCMRKLLREVLEESTRVEKPNYWGTCLGERFTLFVFV